MLSQDQRPPQPKADGFFEGENMLRMVASAIVRLSQQSGPGDPVYDATVQNTYNQLVLLCLGKGHAPPGSVPEMVRWAAERSIGEWPWTLPEDFDGASAFLVDELTRTPTQQCWEWRIAARDVAAEQVENQLMLEAISECRAARAPASYTAFRKLLISKPVLTDAERVALGDDLDLELLHDVIKRCYDPVPASYVREGVYAVCARCGCLLVPIGRDRYVCELDRCRRDQHTRVGRRVEARRSGLYQLNRPLRMFITGPGLAETDLEAELSRRGVRVEMWPNFDAYDLRITLPRGRVWAVDVKDRANPALLGRSALPLRSDPLYDEGFLVAPQYRFDEREDYGRVYARHRTDAPGVPDLISDTELLARVDRELARSQRNTADRDTVGGAADA
ncbi:MULTISPECIES: restriction endonuclease-related protein [Prauserella salsuginis group]|uniref:REase associating with pPIWI RE domain-containing protein n=1 Tax=Prauserella salsuginis TaxID=387889 RepID=A0ABW6G056_9PSEU|nr:MULTISPECIES: hypothetical protein [Prauserella salsuginis group]MCR3721195.1 hypothetical protein [Prauserella flava]MCR3734724.1 hypothetical protein [Prauserella salsuginis]